MRAIHRGLEMKLHVRMIRLDVHQVRPRRVVPAMEEHLRFIALLKARDEAGAVRAMGEHIDSSPGVNRVLQARHGSS